MKQDKDILLAHINTLTNQECRHLYLAIVDGEYRKDGWYYFDSEANMVDNNGVVRLTEEQYNRLIFMWGKDKFKDCVKILAEWLQSKSITKNISHYKNLIGWVERKYFQVKKFTHWEIKKNINFVEITGITHARRYIQAIPEELREDDTYVKFLVNKFGIKIMKGIK